jgi:hypothetical protein
MAWFPAEIFAAALYVAASGAAATTVPADVRVDESERTLTFASGDAVISTVTLCPGQVFDQFGIGGPTFSPDFHWVLVDVLGPFAPGNVTRNHALIDVRTGGLILAPRFPAYVEVPSTLGGLSWASGLRATLRYAPDGRTADLHDPPLRPLPIPSCH